jgi:hypothetical protein
VSTGGPASEPPNRLVSSHDHERQSNAARFPAYTLNEHDRLGFIRDVASGDLSGADIASASSTVLHSLAARSFTDGYATLFAASAGFCGVAAVVTWRLVRASDTPPIAKAKTQGTFRKSTGIICKPGQ